MSTIRRQNRKRNFTTIDNEGINDVRLSWKAKGLLVYLLSKPDDWQVYVAQLKTASKDGRDATANGLEELVKHGYVKKEEKRAENGQFGYDYEVYEQPVKVDKSVTDKPKRNSRNGLSVTENTELLNTNKSNTEKLNTEEEEKDSTPDFVLENRKKAKEYAENKTLYFKNEPEPAKAMESYMIANIIPLAKNEMYYKMFTNYTNSKDERRRELVKSFCVENCMDLKGWGDNRMNCDIRLLIHFRNWLKYRITENENQTYKMPKT